MSRKVCVVTGTRAEFGLLRRLMEGIERTAGLELQVVATGTHFSPEFGLTYREIEEAGFDIDARVEMLLSGDTASAVTKSIGLGLIGFADTYERLSPDLIVLLGDRFEILAAASAALVARIPVAHLHGGETTQGAFDEAIRHAVTKMSHLHFVAAEPYRERVIQLGEDPDRVFNVGGLGIDAIKHVELLGREDLEAALGLTFGPKNLLITFHPVTLVGEQASVQQMAELLAALDELEDTRLILTMPNADTGGRALSAMLREFVNAHPYAHLFASLGQRRYFSCMQFVDAVVGNSSSGLAEAPSMGVATINIGERQRGRLQAASVINCTPDRLAIRAALQRLYSTAFREHLCGVVSPYGSGGAVERIIDVIRDHPLSGILEKSFHDLGQDVIGARTKS
jgi:GDP/UDP-N,N'-diacetylbacillosamine 2-epimerase (hydrolysing)